MKQKIVLLLLVCSLLFFAISYETPFSITESSHTQITVSQSSNTDWWPMFQHDPAHTGSSSSIVPETNETLWIFDINEIYSVGFAPSVVDGRVFVGSGRYFWCINSSTGVLLWSYKKPYLDPSTSPAVSNDRVVISGGQNELYCFNVENGNMLWNFTAESWLRSSPVIDNGRVFVGSDDGLYCIDQTDGGLLRKYGGRGCGSPTVVNDKLWVIWGERLCCIDSVTGNQLWESTFTNIGDAHSTVYYQGKLLIGTGYGNNTLYCLNSDSGELIWKYKTEGWISALPAITNDKVFIGDRGNTARVYCLSIIDGSLIWKKTYENEYGAEYSSPVVADGKIILCMGRKLYVLNETDGEILWSYDPPIRGYRVSESHGFTGQSVALAEGRIYLASDEAKLFCFGSMLYYDITVDPQYLDNEKKTFTPLPSSCVFEFSNGTEKNASSPIILRAPLGSFTIKNVTWNGYGVLPRKVSIYLDSDLVWRPLVNCTLPTTNSLILSSSTSSVGFNINVNGRLTFNQEGISYAPILLLYSVTNGDTWNEITQTYTSPTGEYSAIWMPTASGHYIVKAIWYGNTTFPESSIQTYLAVLPVQEQNVISVSSNSKVSNLVFNSSTNELRFNLTELSEPTGYSDVFIPKDIVGNIRAEVFCDGKKVDHDISSIEDSWLLHFTYNHSVHEVVISLTGVSAPFELPINDLLPFLLVSIGIILFAIILYGYKRKR